MGTGKQARHGATACKLQMHAYNNACRALPCCRVVPVPAGLGRLPLLDHRSRWIRARHAFARRRRCPAFPSLPRCRCAHMNIMLATNRAAISCGGCGWLAGQPAGRSPVARLRPHAVMPAARWRACRTGQGHARGATSDDHQRQCNLPVHALTAGEGRSNCIVYFAAFPSQYINLTEIDRSPAADGSIARPGLVVAVQPGTNKERGCELMHRARATKRQRTQAGRRSMQ